MIRVRTAKGAVITLNSNAKFVEVCDESGNLGAIVQSLGAGTVGVYLPSDVEFLRYVKAYKVNSARLILPDKKPND